MTARRAALRQRHAGRHARRERRDPDHDATRSGSAATARTASTSQGLIDEVRVYNRALTADRDPGRHERADRADRAGHDAAVRARPALTATAASRAQVNLSWTRRDRQRRRGRLPRRALPGRRLHELRRGGDADRDRVQRHRPGGVDAPIATACAPSTRPATSAPTRRSPRRPRRRRRTRPPPSAPTGLDGDRRSAPRQIDLTWTAATDNVGVTEYRVERCQGAGCTNFAQIGRRPRRRFSNTGPGGRTRPTASACARPTPPATSARTRRS